tara:strand:- start:1377 stop:1565 length:189 start_codon:yes stop_codon:yes gene_type:complete
MVRNHVYDIAKAMVVGNKARLAIGQPQTKTYARPASIRWAMVFANDKYGLIDRFFHCDVFVD